jgi:hypothetical protein
MEAQLAAVLCFDFRDRDVPSRFSPAINAYAWLFKQQSAFISDEYTKAAVKSFANTGCFSARAL